MKYDELDSDILQNARDARDRGLQKRTVQTNVYCTACAIDSTDDEKDENIIEQLKKGRNEEGKLQCKDCGRYDLVVHVLENKSLKL